MPPVYKKVSNGRFAYRPAGVATELTIEQTTTSTGTQNNFSLSASLTTLRCNNASDITLTGFTVGGSAPVEGDEVLIISVGAGNVFLAHENASSTAANRLTNLVTASNTFIAAGAGSARYKYDGTSSRWRLVAHVTAPMARPTFAAGDYVASGGGGAPTWTVASGDEGGTNRRVSLVGRTVTMLFHLVDTSVAGGPVTLEILLPQSLQVGVNGFGTFRYKDNGTFGSGYWIASTGSPTKLLLRKIDDSAWANSTDNSDFLGTAIFAAS